MKWIQALAWLISGLFHPLLLGWALPAWRWAQEQQPGHSDPFAPPQWWLFSGLLMVPVLLLFLLKHLGHIGSYLLPERNERNLVYAVSLSWFLVFALGMKWLQTFGPESLVYDFLWLNAGCLLLLLPLNLRVNKASAHAAAGSALFMYLSTGTTQEVSVWLMAVLWVLILASRFVLKAHSAAELLAGSLCGATTALLVLGLR
ncbi:MAG: hypothetical protein RL160_1280 [Bacteroidota bacterium]|jgi:membrane-associated phospholipid phosphatase